MGLFDNIRKKENINAQVDEYFKLLNAYTPTFRTLEGGVYEMELTRAAIHSFAQHASKLKPIVNGKGNTALERALQYKPNSLQDTKKYLYRLATAREVDNNVFIAPSYNEKGEIIGYFPLVFEKCRLVKGKDGVTYVRYDLGNGQYAACELSKLGLLNQFQFKHELFGENNACLRPTLELIDTNNQGIINGVKNSASIRFLAKLAMTLKPADLEEERKRFTSANLSSANNGGVMLFDQKYADVKQVQSQPFTVDSAQMAQIKENVFDYFGTNDAILQNKYTSDEWNAYYEGKIEPFAIELSLVHTNMTFNAREVSFGNSIIFTANRLQYLSNAEKLNTVTQLFDRGFLTHNEGLEIFNMAPVDGGDKRYIRKEYAETDKIDEEVQADANDAE